MSELDFYYTMININVYINVFKLLSLQVETLLYLDSYTSFPANIRKC